MKKIYLLLFFIFATNLHSLETSSLVNYGVGASIGFNNYPSSFSKFAGIPNCCPTFSDANGISYGFGGIYEYYFDNIGISSSLSINNFEGEFLEKEDELFSVNYEPVWGTFNHHLNFNITSIDLGIGAKYKLDDFTLGLGLIASVPISSNFHQFESITVPNGRVFFLDSNGNNTGKNTRNDISGDIPDLSSINFSPNLSLSYYMPLTKSNKYTLEPKLSINYQLNNIVNKINWKRFEIKFSLNLLLNNQQVSDDMVKDEINETKINQDSLIAELELQKKLENERISEKRKKDSLEKINELNKIKIINEMAKLDNLEKIKKEREQQIANERLAFDKMIEEQNRQTGKKCNCFIIQLISTTDRNEFLKLKKKVSELYIKDMVDSEFIEPYQKVKYYRLQSECYKNHLDAFDDRAKLTINIDDNNFLPQILCK